MSRFGAGKKLCLPENLSPALAADLANSLLAQKLLVTSFVVGQILQELLVLGLQAAKSGPKSRCAIRNALRRRLPLSFQRQRKKHPQHDAKSRDLKYPSLAPDGRGDCG